jgi:hypothetical protein
LPNNHNQYRKNSFKTKYRLINLDFQSVTLLFLRLSIKQPVKKIHPKKYQPDAATETKTPKTPFTACPQLPPASQPTPPGPRLEW